MVTICNDCPQPQHCGIVLGACPRRLAEAQQKACGLAGPVQIYHDPWPFATEAEFVAAMLAADSDGGECD